MANNYLRDVTVLIVDDQEFIHSLVRQMLRVLGCTKMIHADNGDDAWQIVMNKPVDLVITDWYMEPVDGIELTDRIRNNKLCPNPYLPVIMMSGFAERARIYGARDSGINEFVVKPLSARALFGRIQNVIEHPRQFVRTQSFFGPDRRRRDKPIQDDRRGKGGSDDAPKPDMTADMKQDEVDAFLNPDSVPEEGDVAAD